MIEQRYMYKNKQNNIGAGYFFLLDNKLNPKPNGFDTNNEYKSSLYEISRDYISNVINKHEDYINNIGSNNIAKEIRYEFIEICKYITIKLLTSLSLQDMNTIITNLVTSNPYDFQSKLAIASILHDINGYSGIDAKHIENLLYNMYTIDTEYKKEFYNYLSRFIFIVSDVRDLVNCIKTSSIYKDTNPGPIKERGGHSMIGNILYEFDRNFRYSIYNHYLLYNHRIKNHYLLHNYSINNDNFVDLRFDNFSYKNIHCNLGFCKW